MRGMFLGNVSEKEIFALKLLILLNLVRKETIAAIATKILGIIFKKSFI